MDNDCFQYFRGQSRAVMDDLLHTPLEAAHLAQGGRLVPFGGWLMPVQYSSILAEHAAVRTSVGVFDISHMGEFFVRGADHVEWLNEMLANDLSKLAVGEGQYTLMLNEQGGVIDDLIAYRVSQNETLLIVNASMIKEDADWLEKHLADGVQLDDASDDWAALAVQGPNAKELFHKLFPSEVLPDRNGIRCLAGGELVCRTGYTGEDGFELLCSSKVAPIVFESIISAGALPCGLGARDTLRLEMGFPLNGNDLSKQKTPIEAGLGAFCAMKKGDFIGREVLAEQKERSSGSRLVGLQMTGKGPPLRPHYTVETKRGDVIGELTSGALSPSLGKAIGMAYLPEGYWKIGTPVVFDIRGRKFDGEVTKKPFLKSKK